MRWVVCSRPQVKGCIYIKFALASKKTHTHTFKKKLGFTNHKIAYLDLRFVASMSKYDSSISTFFLYMIFKR